MRSKLIKRIFDLIVSLILLILISPLLLLLSFAVYFFLGNPVLFQQKRPGEHAKLFTIYKFRTMKDDRDPEGRLLSDAERLTSFGNYLRRNSLDELPELLNVIRGDMSLVGPRPLLERYLDRYSPEEARRHEVKPGITGWAQVNKRNAASWSEKFAMDVWYIDNRSFGLDLKILVLTVIKVIKREGINQPGHATMEEFKG